MTDDRSHFTIEKEIADLLNPNVSFKKDVSPHFVSAEPVGFQETISDILKRVDESEIREDVFLQATALTYTSLESRLRHRADMMRRRADDFDAYADAIRERMAGLRGTVESVMDHISGLDTLLDEHAHIEPEVIKP